MKTCPKCQSVFDDSYGVCFNDGTALPGAVISPSGPERICRYCKESVKQGATVCPHCRKDISAAGTLNEFSNTIMAIVFWGAVLAVAALWLAFAVPART